MPTRRCCLLACWGGHRRGAHAPRHSLPRAMVRPAHRRYTGRRLAEWRDPQAFGRDVVTAADEGELTIQETDSPLGRLTAISTGRGLFSMTLPSATVIAVSACASP